MLHMNGGDGEMSYAKNSSMQRHMMTRANSIREEAIIRLHNSMFQRDGGFIGSLAMADLGCATGPNAPLVAHQLITTVRRIGGSMEIQVFLNDLPSNDFNDVFKGLPEFHQKLKDEVGVGLGSCFVNAVPGSFYGRLFPANSMHFFHSSSSLQWLSQAPKGIERSKGRSQESIKEAYYEQFRGDFSTFLKCRSEELVSGGCMVLTIPIRYIDDDEYSLRFLGLLIETLIQMNLEGMIDEGKMDTFNLPLYTPSMEEIENEINKEGSFTINHSEQLELELEVRHVVGMTRSGLEPLLLSHFGEDLSVDQLFQRFESVVIDIIAKESPKNPVTTVSLTKY